MIGDRPYGGPYGRPAPYGQYGQPFPQRPYGPHDDVPLGILLAVVVGIVFFVPFFFSDSGEAITEFISELLSPVGLLLLPVVLLLTIQFLSSDRGSFLSNVFSGDPNSFHRTSGSPVGVALVLMLVLFLLYNRVSIFGGDDDSDD